jgi:hypothetical protein
LEGPSQLLTPGGHLPSNVTNETCVRAFRLRADQKSAWAHWTTMKISTTMPTMNPSTNLPTGTSKVG